MLKPFDLSTNQVEIYFPINTYIYTLLFAHVILNNWIICFLLIWSIMFIRLCLFVCLFLILGLKIEQVNAQLYRRYRNKLYPYRTLVVDSLGQGNFSTIQSAIDSIPSNNNVWICIKVKEGTYR